MFLDIKDLCVEIDGKQILRGLNLSLPQGEVHAIMGPNGAGKSTLSCVLAGREGYTVTGGSVTFMGRDLLAMSTEERATAGVFLAFQYPVEIPGVSNLNFLKYSLNAVRKARGETELDAVQVLKILREKAKIIGMTDDMLRRPVNCGFSGGEKKRNEILQMLVLEPQLCILDETDSGLDIDALKTIAAGINSMRSPDRTMLMITHYRRLLDYIQPDTIHVLAHGQIKRSGGAELAEDLEESGYVDFT